MKKRTSSLIQKIYKSLLIGALGVAAFVLRLQDETPTAGVFEQVRADVPNYGLGPDGGPGPDCPGPGGDGPCG